MSKMSQLHAELTEQAYDLGFESIEEAEANGYHINYCDNQVKLTLDMAKAQEQAHEAWLKEKDILLRALTETQREAEDDGRTDDACVIRNAIEFIKKGEV